MFANIAASIKHYFLSLCSVTRCLYLYLVQSVGRTLNNFQAVLWCLFSCTYSLHGNSSNRVSKRNYALVCLISCAETLRLLFARWSRCRFKSLLACWDGSWWNGRSQASVCNVKPQWDFKEIWPLFYSSLPFLLRPTQILFMSDSRRQNGLRTQEKGLDPVSDLDLIAVRGRSAYRCVTTWNWKL